MSMFSALDTAVTGVSLGRTMLDVISNNVANANTVRAAGCVAAGAAAVAGAVAGAGDTSSRAGSTTSPLFCPSIACA